MSLGGGTGATLRDVAKRAGVSYQTVSRALNRPQTVRPATLKRVLQAADDLGYVPDEHARALRQRALQQRGQTRPEQEAP